jgi:MFS transporter, putative metabolite:H+ symporter
MSQTEITGRAQTRPIRPRGGPLTADNLVSRLNRLPTTKTVYTAMVLLTLAWIVEAIDIGLVGSTILITGDLWSLSSGQVGLLGISGTVGILIGLLPSGALSDRYGRRVVLAGGLLWFGIFTLLAGLSRNLEMLLALRFLAGLGMGAVFPVPYVLTVELVRPANRYSLVSVQNGILAAAYLVPSLVSGVLVEQLSPDLTWRAAYLFGLLPLLVFVPVLLWLPESPRWLIAKGRLDDAERVIEKMEDEAGLDHDRALRTEVGWSGDDAVALTPAGEATGELTARTDRGAPASSFAALLSSRYRLRSVVAFAAYSAGLLNWYVMLVYAPKLLNAHGFTESESFFITAVLVAIIGVGQFSQGFLADARGIKVALGFYGLIGTLGIGLLAYAVAADSPVWVVGLAFAVTGLFGVGVVPMQKVFLSEQYPTSLRGKGVGAGEFVARLFGGILAIYYVPALLEWSGQPLLFALCAGCLLATTLAILRFGRESKGLEIG